MGSYSCFKITQWGYGEGVEPSFIYLTAIPLKDLYKVRIDRWAKDNRDGYQRDPKPSRFEGSGSVTAYLLKELGAFPTSILINVRGEMRYESKAKLSDMIEVGEVTISNDSEMIIIDGQHRIEALRMAVKQEPELENYPLPVSLMNLKERFDEMVHFYIVNSRQKSIPTDLVYRHLQRFLKAAAVEGKTWLKEVILKPKERRKGLAMYFVDFLNESSKSPFNNRIRYLGEPRESHHLIDDFGLARFIAKLFKERALSGVAPSYLANLLADYWSVIKELYPDCFEKPAKYTLLKTTGVACFTYLFPTIFSYCARDANLTNSRLKYYLSMLKEETNVKELDINFRAPMDELWWSIAHGPAINRVTSEGGFNHIVMNMAKKIEIVMESRAKSNVK